MTIKATIGNEEISNPSLSEIAQLINNTDEWNMLSLVCHDNENTWMSQLVLIVEKPHGVILRFCPKDGQNEYVYKQNEPTDEMIKTFDGGDTWVVPRTYFTSLDKCEEVISHYLNTGTKIPSDNWHIIGFD